MWWHLGIYTDCWVGSKIGQASAWFCFSLKIHLIISYHRWGLMAIWTMLYVVPDRIRVILKKNDVVKIIRCWRTTSKRYDAGWVQMWRGRQNKSPCLTWRFITSAIDLEWHQSRSFHVAGGNFLGRRFTSRLVASCSFHSLCCFLFYQRWRPFLPFQFSNWICSGSPFPNERDKTTHHCHRLSYAL